MTRQGLARCDCADVGAGATGYRLVPQLRVVQNRYKSRRSALPVSSIQEGFEPDPPRVRRAMVVVDLVESVQLMHTNEADVIARWRRFLGVVRSEVLPLRQGRMVKSLGDGMLLEFASSSLAVDAALEIQRCAAPINAGRPEELHMLLRAGVHVCEVVITEDDVFGSGVNLAARLAALAGPGEVVISGELQEQLLIGIEADVEDLGECWVKHLPEPIRAFRLCPPGTLLRRHTRPRGRGLRPTVAVLPRPIAARHRRGRLTSNLRPTTLSC